MANEQLFDVFPTYLVAFYFGTLIRLKNKNCSHVFFVFVSLFMFFMTSNLFLVVVSHIDDDKLNT